MIRIGILALQGAFVEHAAILKQLGADTFEIRQRKDADQEMDGLVLPGGESTTMGKLLKDLDLHEPLKQKIEQGLPVLGTCAGLILLAKDIEGREDGHFKTMDVTVRRNAYGRQLGSFVTTAPFQGNPLEMVFIRAPYIASYGDEVDVLATVDDRVVAARQGQMIGTAFHPELSADPTVHALFLSIIKKEDASD
ncbi:MAG: pyridoxal 5'-phosphate synthase glutaminase subunit PdxT [Acholeplasmataceae bacterium]|nr:MAG: pyridoxal 5'-phosphate synthase glutaminase subunit PdxT [Acholeplasmataceae bacterium]